MTSTVRARWRILPHILGLFVVVPCAGVLALVIADTRMRSDPDGAYRAEAAVIGALALVVFGFAWQRFARRGMIAHVDGSGVVARGVFGRRRLAFTDLVEDWTLERRMAGFRVENVYYYEGPRGRVRISELHQANAEALVVAVDKARRAIRR